MIWIFTEGEGDGIESRLPFKIFTTLEKLVKWWQFQSMFISGAMHEEGQGPDQEEVLMAIKINDTKIALKSGYNKYMKVQGNGQVLGISDAVGAMEQLEPIFQVLYYHEVDWFIQKVTFYQLFLSTLAPCLWRVVTSRTFLNF